MRNVILFIAMSMDGYIADEVGNVEWLAGEHANQNDMQSYETFIKDVDTVLMGWNTYHQIVTQLSSEHWYYTGLQSYVFTHREIANTKEITFVSEDPVLFVNALKQTEGKNIWICGGAHLASQFIEANAIDRYHISIIPILLGCGIRLFEHKTTTLDLTLVKTSTYNGIVDIVYERRKASI